MRRIFMLFLLFLLANYAYTQRDTIVTNGGEKRAGTIGRIGENKLYFLESGQKGYIKIDLDQIEDYSIGDDFFKMNSSKRMEAEFVYDLEGFTSDEIYRALIDWIKLNQKNIFSNGINFTNQENAIVIGSLFTEEYFNLDLLTLLKYLGEGVVNGYFGLTMPVISE